MRGRETWDPARSLRAEFGARRVNRALIGAAVRLAALASLCLLGLGFLIG